MDRQYKGRSESYYLANAADAVDPAIRLRHHPLRGVDSVHLQLLTMGTCDYNQASNRL